jgi:uncharacterized protein YecE (DUF72 family)
VSFSSVKVGCCGFPLTKPQYAARFPVVEVQQTFYQPPRIATLERWRAQVPEDFEFTLKAWQLITHSATNPTYKRVTRRLSDSERRECGSFQPAEIVQEAWRATRACAETLSARCVLFQCPASFTPTDRNAANLRAFFSGIDRRGLRLAWEPRGDWPEALVESLCRELDLVHAVDPFQRRSVTRDCFYYRLHGGKDYRHRFADFELRQLLAVIPSGKPAYVLFNNLGMLDDAARFEKMLHPGQSEALKAA